MNSNLKQKVPLVLLAFLTCLFLQIVTNTPDWNKKLRSSPNTQGEYIDITGFTPTQQGLYTPFGNGTFSISAPDTPISAVLLVLDEPIIYMQGLDVIYQSVDASTNTSFTDGVMEILRADTHYVYLPLTPQVYQSFDFLFYREERMKIKNNFDFYQEHFNQEAIVIFDSFIDYEYLTVQGVYFLSSPWTPLEQAWHSLQLSITLLGTLALSLFYALLWKMKDRVGIYLPFFLVGIGTYAYLVQRLPREADDIGMFYCLMEKFSFWEFLIYRYQVWNARYLVDTMPYFLVHHHIPWAILTSCFCVLLCYALSEIFTPRSLQKNWLIALLFLSYPLDDMGEVGLVSTSTNYLWVLACLAYSLVPIAKILRGDTISKKQWITTYLATLYASNHEQGMALLLGFYLVFFAYFLWEKRPIKPLVLPFSLVIFHLINHFVSPSTQFRTYYNNNYIFDTFQDLSLFTKLEMAYSETMLNLFTNRPFLFILCCYMILFLSFVKLYQQSKQLETIALQKNNLLVMEQEHSIGSPIQHSITHNQKNQKKQTNQMQEEQEREEQELEEQEDKKTKKKSVKKEKHKAKQEVNETGETSGKSEANYKQTKDTARTLLPLLCPWLFLFLPLGFAQVVDDAFLAYQNDIPHLHDILNSVTDTGTNPQLSDISTWIPFGFFLFTAVMLFLSVFVTLENKQVALFGVIVLCAGICSRVMIGLSPTVWNGDQYRTYVYLLFSLIAVCLLVYQELERLLSKKSLYILQTTLLLFYLVFHVEAWLL